MSGAPNPKPAPREKAVRRGLPRQSKKRAKQQAERDAFTAEVRRRRPWCELGPSGPFGRDCTRRTTDVHERWSSGRGGPRVPSAGLTMEMVIALCNNCHIQGVHGHPDVAARLGLLTHDQEGADG